MLDIILTTVKVEMFAWNLISRFLKNHEIKKKIAKVPIS